ncbi:hypothetical protein RJ55_06182 [Drechmeria coniospora]|nr:hypothetical protein RJ55_06182 [Drechmeria coniospora]
MPIRNPFTTRRADADADAEADAEADVDVDVDDEHVPSVPALEKLYCQPGFERVDTVGSKASSILSSRSSRSQDTGEYKMSVVNDSGVYLPPSPTEEKAPWPRKFLNSRRSSDTRSTSSFGDMEHFSISRESFDSYRRSFDISARSPVATSPVSPTGQTFDSSYLPRVPRSAMDRRIERQPPTAEEGFEDVGLEDHKPPPTRLRGFFSKFAESQDRDSAGDTSVSRFFITGRKRGNSGQGAELTRMERPPVADEARCA